MPAEFDHEQVVIRTGPRSGLPVIVAVHSTKLGQAVGGCRVWRYADWRDGLADALRLSAGMTAKCAVAGLANGGGKTVVAVPESTDLDPSLRRRMLEDVADAVASLDGTYATGPDVGTTPQDMAVIGERTAHVFCTPEERGGSGDSSPATALVPVGAVVHLGDVVDDAVRVPRLRVHDRGQRGCRAQDGLVGGVVDPVDLRRLRILDQAQ
ncbi:Glu/Leu/Phe/Val dehydrogenase dimerization domain-containing protein [Nonomuraea sp. SYSU D8015]|uniref:Glu/Leu/Phe/Val dehydrogenase dimerization domain-containing protein n=1 Tax=Nonomuraea sp. SYSU D8015 TaxID=2593644 RepID=UPI001CB6E80A|nr:Glu/Leu/Phe/Val dehydrogenase dimerization domain-containing protein [Nonomuraea sp. SYSU D8015]